MSVALRCAIRRGERGDAELRARVARALEQRPGVRRAVVVTGARDDLEGLARASLTPAEWPAPPRPDDLVVVVEADGAEQALDALATLDALVGAAARPPPGCVNAVRRGGVAVISSSDAALREVTTLVHHYGAGVSHAVRTPPRDLLDEGGGAATLAALDRIMGDRDTSVVAILSTPPSQAVAARVLDHAVGTGCKVVAALLGEGPPARGGAVVFAPTLEDAARAAASMAGGGTVSNHPTLRVTVPRFTREQHWLRGLFAGGALAHEALSLLAPSLRVATNVGAPQAARFVSVTAPSHAVVDFGHEAITRGRAHPRLDLAARLEAVRSVANDPTSLALLLDVPLGEGAHAAPGIALAAAVREARDAASARGGTLVVVASVTGTEGDAQRQSRQIDALVAAGVEVCSSNAAAARRARAVVLGEWP